jgi:iron complex transport system substrate-binding protein
MAGIPVLASLALGLAFVVAALLYATAPIPPDRPQPAPERPAERIVSLMPGLTEIVAAVGAGERLVGISDYCDHPRELCERVPRVGGLIESSLERILARRPDLVLLPQGHLELAGRLAVAGVPARGFVTDSFENIRASFVEIGRMTGHPDGGARLARSLDAELAWLAERGRARGTRPRVLVVVGHRADTLDDIFVAGRDNFLDEILRIAGARNAIDVGGWPPVSRDALVRANPDIVIDLVARGTEGLQEPGAVVGLWDALATLPAIVGDRLFVRVSDAHVVAGPRLVADGVLRDFAGILDGSAPRRLP